MKSVISQQNINIFFILFYLLWNPFQSESGIRVAVPVINLFSFGVSSTDVSICFAKLDKIMQLFHIHHLLF